MTNRLELIGKHKATIVAIEILSLKMGQVDVQPAVCLSLKVSLPNGKLSMLDATLRDFLYENNTPAAQAVLDGVDVVSDKPNLTPAAMALGALHWEYKQTGCTLIIYSGVSGHGDIRLKDGEVRKLKLDAKEGGTVDHYFQFYTADVDAETIGELGILKSLERDIEMTAPEIISQQQSVEEEETPEDALAATVAAEGNEASKDAGGWPFPTGTGTDASDVEVSNKRPRAAAANKGKAEAETEKAA